MELTNRHYIAFLFILGAFVFFFSHDEVSPVVAEVPIVAHVDALQEVSTVAPASEGKYEYLEITEGCSHRTDELCIWAYAGPGLNYEKVYQLEKGMLLKVDGTKEVNGQTWDHVHFDEWIRYPERSPADWYVPSVSGKIIHAGTIETLTTTPSPSNKRIVVDLSDQMLYAYDGDKEFLTARVSTGSGTTPTPTGTFSVYRKTPTRYMQGPLPGVSDISFDLPGVSWDMYFTKDGAAIHGTYWHNAYGTEQSDGCVNLPPELAKILYDWAPLGTKVVIQE